MRTSSVIWAGTSEFETFVHQDLLSHKPFELLRIGESISRYLRNSIKFGYLPECAETKIESDKV